MDADILIISSNQQLTQLMQMELDIEGYSVLVEADSMMGFITARKIQPRLLIMDAISPGLSAIEICNRLRTTNQRLKILLLADINKIQSADFMVDDYLFTPVGLTELLIRVKLNLQKDLEKGKILHFEDLMVNLEGREVFRHNRRIELTFKEFEVLIYLLRYPYQVIERDRLLEEVWDDTFIGSHNLLQVCVYSLRSKLEAAGEPRIIQTVRGVGYVLKSLVSNFTSPTLMCV